MRTAMKRSLAVLAALPLASAPLWLLAGCDSEGPAEQAGEKIDEAADDVGDAVEDAADEIDDAVDDAADEIDDATDGSGG